MYQDVLVNKWFLGVFIFCVICSIGCLIWYQTDMAKFRKEMNLYEEFSGQLIDAKNDTKVAQHTNSSGEGGQEKWDGNVETAAVNADTTEGANTGDQRPNASAVNNSTLPKSQTRRANVSPYGFGPYPEIPEDWPGKYPFNNSSADHELIARVQVELWKKQKVHSKGGIIGKNGLVYPIVLGKVYVEWSEFTDADGTIVRTPGRVLGHPDDLPSDQETPEEVLRRVTLKIPKVINLPSHLEILSFDEGIDPYEFLDLP